MMANRFDIVAVWIEHEGTVVVWMIVRTESGRTIVAAAGGHGGLKERIDSCTICAGERDVCGSGCVPP